MTIGRFARAARDALRVRFLGARIPLAARIQVIRNCPLNCTYCTPPAEDDVVMDGLQVEGLLTELADLGCLRVSFSGGEPMLRKDIGSLVSRCADLGMAPEMNSSGYGFAKRAREVRRLRLLKLSLDGPEEVHDAQRRKKGSYREVLQAIEAARSEAIRTVLVATITKQNVEHVDHVLELAREYGTFAAFQPVKPFYKGTCDVTDLLPDPDALRTAVRRLKQHKRSDNGRHMRQSIAALDHLDDWPEYRPLRCWAGRIFCIIGADGTLYPCDRTEIRQSLPNCVEGGLVSTLKGLPEPDCSGCGFCGAVELNLAMAFDWRIAGSLLRLLR